MFRKTYELASKEMSGENAKIMTSDIWRHDRTCSFDEYCRSARYCVDKLKAAGLKDVGLISFPATGKAKYGTLTIQRAWDCSDAELTLVEPADKAGRLVAYRDEPYCLAQGSPPTPAGGIEAEVVIIKGGASDKDYRGSDVRGKIILTDAAVGSVHKLARKKGAVGLISDCMATNPLVRPTPMDLPDAHMWQVMRPSGELFGFVLSPRQGKQLRDLIAARKKRPVRVRAHVASRLYDGRSEMVSALLKGRTGEEVALIAHLYEPGANDNASGAALCIEVIRTLQSLIRAGKLPRPRRGIRVWLTHEFQSLQAHAYENPLEMAEAIAAVNLDFVGQEQSRTGSTLMYQTGPDAMPSFINHFQRELFEHFRSEFHTWGNTSSTVPYYNTIETGYWGNDNFISDPSIGIPSVALINWPDKFYHTSLDTDENIDPASIARVGTLAATFAYTIANAGPDEALSFAEMVGEQAVGTLAAEVRTRVANARSKVEADTEDEAERELVLGKALTEAHERLEYVAEREFAALESVNRLLSESQQRRAEARLSEIRDEINEGLATCHIRAERGLVDIARRHKLPEPAPTERKPLTPAQQEADSIIPHRKLPGIVGEGEFSKGARDLLAKAGKGGMPRLILFWVDGKRSLLDICRLTRLEGEGGAIDAPRILKWCEGMRRGGAIRITRRRK